MNQVPPHPGGTAYASVDAFLELSKNNDDDADIVEESIIFRPEELLMNCTPLTKDGKPGSTRSPGWDLKKNAKL